MIPDHRQAFQVPLHHPHGATPFTTSPPVVLQEPNVHPAPHDLYVGCRFRNILVYLIIELSFKNRHGNIATRKKEYGFLSL